MRRRAALPGRPEVAEPAGAAQPDRGRLRVRERDAAAGRRLRPVGDPVVPAAAALVLVVGLARTRSAVGAQEHREQESAQQKGDEMEGSEDDDQPVVGSHNPRLPSASGRQTSFRYHGVPPAAPPNDPGAAPLEPMADTTSLSLTARDPEGSRSARRLRREGLVPGVVYGEGGDPQHFAVDARILRNTLAHSGAILEVSVDGGKGVPVLVKDLQRHPVRGEAVHVDLLRVNMAETIHTTVVLELTGAEEAPGAAEGGVLNQETRELNIEALPGDIPDSIVLDVSGLQMN